MAQPVLCRQILNHPRNSKITFIVVHSSECLWVTSLKTDALSNSEPFRLTPLTPNMWEFSDP
jgi:hypothetical protein